MRLRPPGRKAVNLALGTALVAGWSPAAVLGQQNSAAVTTDISAIPPTIRTMTATEKAEYDGWVSAAKEAVKRQQWMDAERILRNVLAREEATFGPSHPEVAGTYSWLASINVQQNRHRDAEPLLRRALVVRENVLRPQHPSVASSLEALAFSLGYQGRPTDAEPLFRRALAIREKVFGSQHPDTAMSMVVLAANLNGQSRWTEAEPLIRHAIAILLGDDATEKNLRARSSDGSLARAKVVAFATHGLIAGDLGRSLAQPALAFTPPAPAEGAVTEANDGLLTAGEAATLKLAADWVILSACNTAAGGSDNSADGLTGLARAFFYAGADSLLVSHWRVRDDAAARLTTRAVEIAAASGSQRISRAGALQQSMRELMNDTSQDKSGASFAHPAAWAPFALVGAERLQRN